MPRDSPSCWLSAQCLTEALGWAWTASSGLSDPNHALRNPPVHDSLASWTVVTQAWGEKNSPARLVPACHRPVQNQYSLVTVNLGAPWGVMDIRILFFNCQPEGRGLTQPQV